MRKNTGPSDIRLSTRIDHFLVELETRDVPEKRPLTENQSSSLCSDIENVFCEGFMRPEDEVARQAIADALAPYISKCGRQWQSSVLKIFGSSRSMFGARNSDLDICLLSSRGSNRIKDLHKSYVEALRTR